MPKAIIQTILAAIAFWNGAISLWLVVRVALAIHKGIPLDPNQMSGILASATFRVGLPVLLLWLISDRLLPRRRKSWKSLPSGDSTGQKSEEQQPSFPDAP